MRLGCSTICFAPLSGESAVDVIGLLGFERVDIAAVPVVFDHLLLVDPPSDQVTRLRALLARHRMSVVAIPTVAWPLDALDDPGELERRSRVAAAAARDLGADHWIVDAGQPRPDRATGLARWEATIAMQADIAREHGLALSIEMPHRGTLAERFELVAELVEIADQRLGAPVGIDLDTSHVHNCGASFAEFLAAYGERVRHVALRDSTGPGTWDMPLGDGDVDFGAVIALLRDAGYAGDLVLELEPPSGTAFAERVARVDAARALIEPLL